MHATAIAQTRRHQERRDRIAAKYLGHGAPTGDLSNSTTTAQAHRQTEEKS